MVCVNSELLVSVVLTVCEGDDNEAFEMAFASIANQSYSAIEILVIVDGVVNIVKANIISHLAEKSNAKVVWLVQNHGPASARNAGILESKGKYIAIMDSDDISHRDRIIIQKSYLEKEGLDIISSPLYIVDENNKIIGERSVPLSAESVKNVAPYSSPLNNPAVFAKSDVLKKNLYNENYRVSEDYDLWVRLLLQGYKLGNTVEKTVYYRQPSMALNKRRGIKYALADIRVKIKAAKLVCLYKRPVVFLFALVAAGARLLPLRIFNCIYLLKGGLYKRKFG